MDAEHQRVAVLTGGAAGIGAAIAERLRNDGHLVASLDIAGPAAPRAGIADLVCDVSDPDAVQAAVGQTRATLGPPAVLVHCAAYQMIAPFDTIDPVDWDRTFRVNVDGAFHLVRAVLPDMRESGWGRIVFITSSSLLAPPRGMTHYVASKGALTGMARALATELGPLGVTVNAVAPGLTATEHALGDVPAEHFETVRSRQAIPRTGRPGDVAAVVAFAVSDEAAFVTGQTVLVDGGASHV